MHWSRWSIVAGACCGACGVGLGALSAHGVDSDPAGALAAQRLKLASAYLLWHAAPLLFCSVRLASQNSNRGAMPWLALIATLFAAGATLFCGSLAALGFGASGELSKVTPIGGMMLIVAWLNLAAWGILSSDKSSGS